MRRRKERGNEVRGPLNRRDGEGNDGQEEEEYRRERWRRKGK
jgi:hypothetical protein